MSAPFLTELLDIAPYSLPAQDKSRRMLEGLNALTEHHRAHCPLFRAVSDGLFPQQNRGGARSLEEVPFLPVSMFKTHELRSIEPEQVFKQLTSSGTTGQAVSRVYLDAATAQLQARVLIKLGQHFLGKLRLPMVIVDHPSVHRRVVHSARSAGILGMLQFARRPFYCLHEDMSLDWEGLEGYLREHQDQPVVFFGFTFMVWQYLLGALRAQGRNLELPRAKLLHSGGWKRLLEQAVDAQQFRAQVETLTGIQQVRSFYGMAEQVGSVFFENDLGYLHASEFSDVIIRDPLTLAPLPPGEVGLIQVVSLLPWSYPGHSILTEDLGAVRGLDVPQAGLNGRYFEMLGRVAQVPLRGCSDTFQPSPPSPREESDPFVQVLAPAHGQRELFEFVEQLPTGGAQHPFDPLRLEGLAELSRDLLASRPAPAVTALAFWLRKANLQRLHQEYQRLESPDSYTLVPNGRVFHMAPSNVDTLFVYSWALSYLCGNANVVRLSGRMGPLMADLLRCLQAWMHKSPDRQRDNLFVSYPHDEEITRALSQWCSLRVVWGGDLAVSQIRGIDLNPHASERLFASKFSYAVLGSSAFLHSSQAERAALMHNFANDVFWFDQRACSSPQVVFWLGEEADRAQEHFRVDLDQELRAHPPAIPASLALERTAQAFSMAAASPCRGHLGSTVNLVLESFADLRRQVCGGGMLQHVCAESIEQIATWSSPEDQTITYFGLEAGQVRELALKAGLRGVDRVVPVGQALQFDTVWDGYNLLSDFTRKVLWRA